MPLSISSTGSTAVPGFSVFHSTADIEKEAEETLRKYTDQGFSYTDAVSFAIMKQQSIKKLFPSISIFRRWAFLECPRLKRRALNAEKNTLKKKKSMQSRR